MLGKVKPDKGKISQHPEARLGHLPKEVNISSEITLKKCVKWVTGVEEIEIQLKDLQKTSFYRGGFKRIR